MPCLATLFDLNMFGSPELAIPPPPPHSPKSLGCYVFVWSSYSLVCVQELQAAANEVSILSQLEHPGIIEYFEYMLDDEGYLNIVMEWAPCGDLHTWIREHKGPSSLVLEGAGTM